MTKKRFFIALLPPQEVQDSINEIKQYFADQYNSYGAQKSPPHITLQPPFELEAEELINLKFHLNEFVRQQDPIPLTLSGFSAFPPKVIYIDVIKNPELLKLQSSLIHYLEIYLNLLDQKGKNRSFTPHLTVAFRDLKRHQFHAAWAEFKDRPFQAQFIVPHLTLLVHDGKRWNIDHQFSFS